jgi:hypothetical protein
MVSDLNLNELVCNLKYDSKTGVIVWVGKRFGVTNGMVAGTISKRGYRIIQFNSKTYVAHRIAWYIHYGKAPDEKYEIDHIDGNKLNNAIDNLRLTTRSFNCKNTKIRKTNSSGVIGVHKVTKSGKWQARINGLHGERIVLGTFERSEEHTSELQSR